MPQTLGSMKGESGLGARSRDQSWQRVQVARQGHIAHLHPLGCPVLETLMPSSLPPVGVVGTTSKPCLARGTLGERALPERLSWAPGT